MKFKSLLAVFVACLALGSCGRTAPHQLSEIKNATPADSLAYYLGAMRGIEYNHAAKGDSTLNSEMSRIQFIEGTRAGLEIINPEHEPYNRGVLLGVQIALNMNQFKEEYGVQLPEHVFLEALAYAVENDSSLNAPEIQSKLYHLVNKFASEKEKIE